MAFEPGAHPENAIGDMRVLDNGIEGEPIFFIKILRLEKPFFPGREEVLAPSLIKVFSKFTIKTLEVPVIVTKLRGVHRLAKIGEDSPLTEKSLNLIILVDNAINFARVIDGRISIIYAIVDESVG